MPSDVPFSQVRKLLESHGWTCSRVRGSHHVFTKEGETLIIIPVHRRKVKFGYVRRIKKQLEEEGKGQGD